MIALRFLIMDEVTVTAVPSRFTHGAECPNPAHMRISLILAFTLLVTGGGYLHWQGFPLAIVGAALTEAHSLVPEHVRDHFPSVGEDAPKLQFDQRIDQVTQG